RAGAARASADSRGEPRVRDVDDPDERTLDVVLLARDLPEHPAGEDLLERAVHDPRRDRRIAVRPHLAARLRGLDHARQPEEDLADLLDALADLRAARDLTHEHTNRIRRHEPRTEIEAREAPQ